MRKADVSSIKSMLTAFKDLSLAKPSHTDDPGGGVTIADHAEVQANRRAASQLLEAFAHKAGVQTGEFQQILSRNQASLARLAEQHKAVAIKNGSTVSKNLLAALEARKKAFETLGTNATGATPSPFYISLDSPFMIWPTQGIELIDSHIEPYKSTAKVEFDSGSTWGSEEVAFYFLWENPSDRYSVVNVDAFLIFNGHLRVGQDGGFWPGSRYANLSASGRVHLMEWWNQPPTEPLSQADQMLTAGSVSVGGGEFMDVGALDDKHLFRGLDLRYNLFLVPPKGTVVFKVSAIFSYSTGTDGGHVDVDFSSGDLHVECPYVSIAVLT